MKIYKTINVILFLLVAGYFHNLVAQNVNKLDRGIGKRADNVGGERRIALIIGNGIYDDSELSLNNPVNDALDMSNKLRDLQFEVIGSNNLNKQSLEREFKNLPSYLSDAKVFLFYYAGHGVQVDGENYLVPVDARISKTDDIKERAVNLRLLLTELQGQSSGGRERINIIILDACRNNPFNISQPLMRELGGQRTVRSTSQGLAKIEISELTNTLIAYSTQTDSLASDGVGRNGLYTASLLAEIDRKGRKLLEVFQQVRGEVERKSNKKQIPWELSSLKEDFYFIKPDPVHSPSPVPPSDYGSEGRWAVTTVRSYDLKTSRNLFDTGLVIQAGTAVTIKIANSGKVNLGSTGYVGPAGGDADDKAKPAQDCKTGAVIARIGESFYCVKEVFDQIIKTTGPLWLGINESNLADNTGSYAVKVQLQQLQRY